MTMMAHPASSPNSQLRALFTAKLGNLLANRSVVLQLKESRVILQPVHVCCRSLTCLKNIF